MSVHPALRSAAILFMASWACATPAADLAQQHFLQGLAYERLGRLSASYSELQIASTLQPDDPQIALALGLVAVRFGRLEMAQRALEQSIVLQADSVASYFELAMLYESKAMNERALDAWHRFAGLSQDDVLKQMAQKHIRRLEQP